MRMTRYLNDIATDYASAAHDRYHADVQHKCRAILDQIEMDNGIAILMIGRPYHMDPGLHHGIPDEFQVLGYPIVSIRSIPKDPEWLGRFFKEDLDKGLIRSP